MSATKKKRLFKIASEINIGKDAIVQFLEAKGFKVENKPTFMLAPEMVEAVMDKFKKEKQAADKQREKLEKHKKIRTPKSDELGEEVYDASLETQPESSEESDETETTAVTETKPVEETADISPEPDTETVEHDTEPEPETEDKTNGPKVGQVIDLSSGKPVQKKEEQKPEPEPEPVVETVQTDVQPEPEEVKPEPQPETEAKAEEPQTKAEKPEPVVEQEAIEPEQQDDKPAKAKPQKQTGPKEQKPKADHGQSEDQDDKNNKKNRRRKKKKRVAEIDPETGDAPKLKGLTIVGKIDLKKDQPSEDKRDRRGSRPTKKKGKPGTEETEAPGAKAAKKKKLSRAERKAERRKKKKISVREMISDEDVNRAMKETLAKMNESHGHSNRSKMKQKRKAVREEKEQKIQEEIQKEKSKLKCTEFVTTADLSNLMNIGANEIILKCMELGLMVTLNQRLDKDTITLIADDYGYEVEFQDNKNVHLIEDEEDPEESLMPRSPIVTVMGHVDHGKTSLLDYIRHANVVAGEAGGITQHIAAYKVKVNENKYITFLDTPGHEAFTAMRARGAQVTDLVVLVVAADDSVMPQTIEAINHAQAAGVPIVVAINKMDKPDAQPDRIKQQLADKGILVEDWGGTYQSVEISAKAGTNIDLLLEKIMLEAEMLDLKANPDRTARSAVIEAHMDKGFGSVATVIVQKGTLSVGDSFVAGMHNGKIRAMFDHNGRKVTTALPSQPILAIGFNGVPEAGDVLAVVDGDTEARNIANERQQLKREQEYRQVRHITLDDISQQIQMGGVKELFLIIKGDVAGSVEALSDALEKQSQDEVKVSILLKGVGSITESDVMLAVASNAVIIGFQTSPTANARKLAESESVDIRLYNIIYDCINEIRLALEGLLTPETREEITSNVEVRKVFKISKLGNIAGCYVKSGKIHRNDRVRLLRDGLPVYNGTIHSLKREKDDTKEVDTGFECGIMLDNFNAFEEGDIIEGYKLAEYKRTFDS